MVHIYKQPIPPKKVAVLYMIGRSKMNDMSHDMTTKVMLQLLDSYHQRKKIKDTTNIEFYEMW